MDNKTYGIIGGAAALAAGIGVAVYRRFKRKKVEIIQPQVPQSIIVAVSKSKPEEIKVEAETPTQAQETLPTQDEKKPEETVTA